MPGLFISLEGPEKAGKSTTANLLQNNFSKAHGITPLFLREPGGTPIGDQIRQVIHDMKNGDMDPGTELLLYAASRRQLVAQFIKPHLEKGGIVICDRFADTTRTYQGAGRGMDDNVIEFLINFATQGIAPDLTFLFDIDVEKAFARRTDALEWNRMDAQEIDFYKRAMVRYHELVRKDPERWYVIDASKSIDEVYRDVETKIVEKIKSKELLEGRYPRLERK